MNWKVWICNWQIVITIGANATARMYTKINDMYKGYPIAHLQMTYLEDEYDDSNSII